MVKESLQHKQIELLCEFNGLGVIKVNPHDILLLEKNSNFMDKKNFDLLVENIKKDDTLTSLPLCIYDFEKDGIVVISGNHRVKACMKIGMEKIPVLIFLKDISKDDALRLQLGHNAIHGKDDIEILKEILKEFGDVENIKYTGVDEEYFDALPEMENIKLASVDMELKEITFIFGEEYIECLKNAVEKVEEGAEYVAIVSKKYPDFLKMKNDFLSKYNAKNIIDMAGSCYLMEDLLSKHAKEPLELGDADFDGYVSCVIGSDEFLLEKPVYEKLKKISKDLGGGAKVLEWVVDSLEKR